MRHIVISDYGNRALVTRTLRGSEKDWSNGHA